MKVSQPGGCLRDHCAAVRARKFSAIDTGAKLESRPISVIPITTVPPPASVTLTSHHQFDQGLAVSTMTIAWPPWKGLSPTTSNGRRTAATGSARRVTSTTSVDVTIYAGWIPARVRAVSAFDITSVWKSSILTLLSGETGAPPALAFPAYHQGPWKIGLEWGFTASGGGHRLHRDPAVGHPGGSASERNCPGLVRVPDRHPTR